MEDKKSTEIDLEAILAPISEEHPTGKDLRDDTVSPYYSLKKLRNDLRQKEDKELLDGGSIARIKWGEVIKGAGKILAEESKDLEVAAWLVEALLRENGFSGLGDGTQILTGLVDQYWGTLYPQEDDDFEITIAPLEGLGGRSRNGVLIKPLNMLPLVTLNNGRSISTWDYISALDLYSSSEAADDEAFKGITPMDDLQEMCLSLDAAIFIDKKALIETDLQDLDQLYELLKEKTEGKWSFSFSIIENALGKSIEALHFIGAFAFEVKEVPEPTEVVDGADAVAGTDTPVASQQQQPMSQGHYVVNNAEDVRSALKAVEDFYRNNHPHSPMAYLIKRASDWSAMSLAQLIPQILSDDHSQMEYCRMIGLDPSELSQGGEEPAAPEQFVEPPQAPPEFPME